jgi:hypothetical protein
MVGQLGAAITKLDHVTPSTDEVVVETELKLRCHVLSALCSLLCALGSPYLGCCPRQMLSPHVEAFSWNLVLVVLRMRIEYVWCSVGMCCTPY